MRIKNKNVSHQELSVPELDREVSFSKDQTSAKASQSSNCTLDYLVSRKSNQNQLANNSFEIVNEAKKLADTKHPDQMIKQCASIHLVNLVRGCGPKMTMNR